MTAPTPEQRLLLAFADLSPAAKEVVGETLERLPVPFLSSLGSSLCYGPKMAEMVLRLALRRVSWDGSATLADRLGDNEPWKTVKECLVEAIATTEAALAAENGKNPHVAQP